MQTIADAVIQMREGRLTGHGQYHFESSDFAYEFDSTLDPTRLQPLMFPSRPASRKGTSR